MKKEFVCSAPFELHGSVEGEGKNLSMYNVRVRPVPEDKSNNPKYNCPVCLALGLRHRVIKTERKPWCPICNVYLDWTPLT